MGAVIPLGSYEDLRASRAALKAAKLVEILAANPGLFRPADTKGGSLIAAKKNLLIELKARWPSVKFSARTSRYSMGDSLRVGWVDGPSVAEVREISGKYSAGHFDGMQDMYEYSSSAWTEAFGDAKYVFEEREYSDKAVASAIRIESGRWGFEPFSVEAYRKRSSECMVRLPNMGNWDASDLVYQRLVKMVWCLPKA